MRMIELASASEAFKKLIVQDMPMKQAYSIVLLVDRCNPHLSFYGNEILKRRTAEQIEELNNMRVEGFDDFEKIKITLSDDIKLSASDIKCLEPFIDFVGG